MFGVDAADDCVVAVDADNGLKLPAHAQLSIAVVPGVDRAGQDHPHLISVHLPAALAAYAVLAAPSGRLAQRAGGLVDAVYLQDAGCLGRVDAQPAGRGII